MRDSKSKYEVLVEGMVIHDVKLIIANEENIAEYGRLVYDFDEEKVSRLKSIVLPIHWCVNEKCCIWD